MGGDTSEPPHMPCTPERDLARLKWWIQHAQATCFICSVHCATGSRAHSPCATQLCRFIIITETPQRSETRAVNSAFPCTWNSRHGRQRQISVVTKAGGFLFQLKKPSAVPHYNCMQILAWLWGIFYFFLSHCFSPTLHTSLFSFQQ